jgi:putative transposase
MESFFSSLETDRIGNTVCRSRDAAGADLVDHTERLRNPLRRHPTIGKLSPVAFERKAGPA